ncbi:hypothetical protein EVAR_98177_1 [Eumeta japonica]|uniref:Uncharacterized protein n=1 Tax=Eumeta variegata TaxID=151549 RepID=A0A4C1YIA1_EUMVA|nr:hypothetical protein EVAR_98177_1 [Eumeta japonica]
MFHQFIGRTWAANRSAPPPARPPPARPRPTTREAKRFVLKAFIGSDGRDGCGQLCAVRSEKLTCDHYRYPIPLPTSPTNVTGAKIEDLRCCFEIRCVGGACSQLAFCSRLHPRWNAVVSVDLQREACKGPESRWSSPPMDTRNLRGVTSALPLSEVEK